MIKKIEDMDFCYYNLTYLLSMGCSGSFCANCIYKEKDHRCMKWNIRKIMEIQTDHNNRTIETQTELITLIDIIKETTMDTCSLSGYCMPNKCPFYDKVEGNTVCKRMRVRELILEFERKQA
jgi:hypothetical protein